MEQKRVCPNCNSSKFIETVAVEECPDCNLRCGYQDGSGPNEVYLGMMRRQEGTHSRLEEEATRIHNYIVEEGLESDCYG